MWHFLHFIQIGGIITKIKIKGYLKNITENQTIEFETTAIKEKDKYKYIINNEKYILKTLNSNKIILNRDNNEYNCIMYFETNKKTSSEYTLKEKNISIPIDIKTTNIKITATKINRV